MEPVILRDWRSAVFPLAVVSVLPFVVAGTLLTTPAFGVGMFAGAAGLLCLLAAWNCLERRVTLSADLAHTRSPLGGERRLVLEHLATLRLREHRILVRATGSVELLIRDRAGNEVRVRLEDKAAFETIAPWVKSVCATLATSWQSQLSAGQSVSISDRISLSREQLQVGRRLLPLAPHFELKEYSAWLSAVLEVRNGNDLLSIHGDEENYLPLREALRNLYKDQRVQLGAQS
jgi:hypothetical protein